MSLIFPNASSLISFLPFSAPPKLKATYKQYYEAIAGDVFSLKCPFRHADPPASVIWRRNGQILNSASGDRFSASGKRLEISNVIYEDSGNYTCTATNNIGSDVIAKFVVEVTGKDYFLNKLTKYEIDGR